MSKGSRTGKEGTFIHFDTQSPSLSQPRAKSPSPVTQAPSGSDPPKRFQFIDNTSLNSGSNNSTQVRRHVMQEFMRQKRWNNAKQQPSSPGKGSPPARRPVQKIRAQKKRSQPLPSSSSSTPRPATPGLDAPSTSSGHTSPLSSASFPTPTGPMFHSAPEPSFSTSSFPIIAPESQASVRRKRRADVDVSELSRNRPVKFISMSNPRRKLSPRRAYATAFSLIGRDLEKRTSTDSPPSTSLSEVSNSDVTSLDRFLMYLSRRIPHPRSSLSAARTDPFKTLPINLDDADQELFDFYVNVMPTASSGFHARSCPSSSRHNWYLSVFVPEAMRNALAFQTVILAHAASAFARIHGCIETRLSIEHRHRASSMLRKHFRRHPSDTSDSTIVAMLSAAVLEDFDPRVERKTHAWSHFRAAQKKIRDRGGPAALQSSPRLVMVINWSDYIMTGYHSSAPSFFFDHHYRVRPGGDAAGIGRREVHETMDEFLQFLFCMEHLAHVQSNLARTGLGLQRAPLRNTSFAPGAPLNRILTEPPHPRRSDDHLNGQNRITVTRMACLLMLNAVNWQYRHSVELVETFLAEVNAAITANGLDGCRSSEALCQILLSGSAHPALQDSERPWLVGRMLKLVKRLGRVSWIRLERLLMSYLSLEGVEEQVRIEVWNNGLRWEVFPRPAIEYVMPSMAEDEEEGEGDSAALEAEKELMGNPERAQEDGMNTP